MIGALHVRGVAGARARNRLSHALLGLPGTGIIYTLTTRDAEQVSACLNQCGVVVRPYHANISDERYESSDTYRRRLELALDQNEVKALVATTALGMGYEPDLGFVVHYQASGSIIAYYQQVGRAGRGIGRALGVLLSGVEDGQIHEYFRRTAFPDERWVGEVLLALEDSEDGMNVRDLEQSLDLRYGQSNKSSRCCPWTILLRLSGKVADGGEPPFRIR